PADSADALSLQPYGPDQTLMIEGSGTINICRLRPHTGRTNISVIVDANVTFTYVGGSGTGGSGVYSANDAANDFFTFTVKSGRTVTMVDKCNLATTSSTSTDGSANTTFNVDGTLNMLGGNLSLRTAAGKVCSLNVAGTLNLGGNLYASGTTGVPSVITVSGTMNTGTLGKGTLYFDAPAQTVVGSGTFSLGAGATFRTGAPAGVTSGAGSQIGTVGIALSPGARYAFVGTAAQVTGDLLAAQVRGLEINNASGVTLSKATLVDSVLALTNGALVSDTLGVALGPGGSVTRGSGYVDGYLAKTGFTGTKTFEVGTTGGYSPVVVNATAGTGNFAVRAVDGSHPNLLTSSLAIPRYWKLQSTGITKADITFAYPATDVVGTEASYVAGRNTTGSQWMTYATTVDPVAHTAAITNVTAFSDWTVGESGAFTAFEDPASMVVGNALKTITLDGKLDEPEWTTAPALAYGNGAFLKKGAGQKTVTGGSDIKATFDLPNTDSSLATVKFLRKGTNLYIGIQSDDKSICKFDWEGDGMFMKIKRANGTDVEYKLYYQNIGTAADTIRYEPPGVNYGEGAGFLPTGSTVNDTNDVDNGYSAELMIKLDSLGYTSVLDTVKLALVVFDPDGYQHPMNSYDTTAGSYYKEWWGSEWGGVYRSLLFTPEPVKFDNPDTVFALASAGVMTVDGALSEPAWTNATTLLFGNGAFLKKGAGQKTVTGESDVKATFDLPNTDSSLATVKFLRKGTNLYIGIQSDDKSICKFDWEGDGMFMKIKRANGTDVEYKLYYQNIGTAADTIRYEPPAVNYGAGAGVLGAGSKVNDTTGVDNGYTAELMIKLDSLGYGPTARGVQMALVVFDPDGYQHPMNSYDTTAGSYYKSWWGSEWGGVYGVVAFDNLLGVTPDENGGVPVQFALHQNFPNPFNPSTTIRFDLPAASRVSIVVYDVTGREVASLVQGEYGAGSYSTTLDASQMASGVYFYRMMAFGGNGGAPFVSTNKLLLLK
ncbi:MAG TPA: T9SS type A sorting domain-containing protein, partial [Bacteroidota bacterium]|nr:T9SS type A sorting domain-containing protein [Bacteroidota bacterium]